MQWRKVLTIAYKELFVTFTDRNLLIILVAAPLLISTIVGAVFGGVSGDSSDAISGIRVAIVNQDAGDPETGTNYGQGFVDLLEESDEAGSPVVCPLVDADETASGEASSGAPSLVGVLIPTLYDSPEAARAAVDSGDVAVAVIFPENYSAEMTPEIGMGVAVSPMNSAEVAVYSNASSALSGSIVASIVEGYTNQILTGGIAIASTINTLIDTNPSAAMGLSDESEASAVFACGFMGSLNTVVTETGQVGGATASGMADPFLDVLVAIGAAQMIFFALFTGQFSIISVVEERRQGTLQRIIVTPTSGATYLTGKLLGAVVQVIFQMIVLLFGLSLVGSVVIGQPIWLWGTHWLALVAMILAIALAVSGLGVLLAGLARTPEQVGLFGPVVNIVLGVLGGSFGFTIGPPLQYFSLIYWGADGMYSLATGNADIGLHILVLAIQGSVFLLGGIMLFNRRVAFAS
jgi:ABC-type Na+ efflux pump permease subunit